MVALVAELRVRVGHLGGRLNLDLFIPLHADAARAGGSGMRRRGSRGRINYFHRSTR
eukprot:SAG31_NODE_199_length_20573_cov_5.832129_14_plen_57_part_00